MHSEDTSVPFLVFQQLEQFGGTIEVEWLGYLAATLVECLFCCFPSLVIELKGAKGHLVRVGEHQM